MVLNAWAMPNLAIELWKKYWQEVTIEAGNGRTMINELGDGGSTWQEEKHGRAGIDDKGIREEKRREMKI